jgi:hypothetical protein
MADEDYREYRDAEFLGRVGLADFATALARYWPNRGPSWDALGVVSDKAGAIEPAIILLEAKSYPHEAYGDGCQATQKLSRDKIGRAFERTKRWCSATDDADWLGPLYQSANRIAHLHFFLEELRIPAWLVNLYFTADPIGPTTRDIWEKEVFRTKSALGLTHPVANMIEVHLPALESRPVTRSPHG